jgi:Ca2+-binding RTX toxin-like protein
MRRGVLLIASAVAALVVASGAALAALVNTPDNDTVHANGRVWDILRAGDTVYLAGAFTQITDDDGDTFARNNLAAVDAETGEVTPWDPSATNPNNPSSSSVRSMALSSDGSRLFVGGTFARVGGLSRARVAAVNAATGAVIGEWKANANRPVHALAASGSRVYLGGEFTTLGGQSRERLAAVSPSTGALDAGWRPSAKRGDGGACAVRALELSSDGSRLYAGGTFNQVDSTPTGRLAALSAATGSVVSGFQQNYPNTVLAMEVSGSRLFVGTGDPLEGVEAIDGASGRVIWSVGSGHPAPSAGDVQAITVEDQTVYAGGHFTRMGGLVRNRLAEFDEDTGQIGPWAPKVAGGNLGVWALETDASHGRLYAGGDFTQIGGVEHQRFARFSDAPLPQPPPCTITGTSSADVLNGTPADDVICGGAGNDTIKGLEGNDMLRGEAGGDKLHGGAGNDELDGGNATDWAYFSDSPAAVTASLADNTATGEGSDTLANLENLGGSNHDDTLVGSGEDNSLTGSGGNDVLSALAGADALTGGGQADTVRGGSGDDSVVGSGGADELFGEDGDDTVDSRDGVNGNDSLDGGAGTDTAITDATESFVVGFP